MRGTTHRLFGLLLYMVLAILVFPGLHAPIADKLSPASLLVLLAVLFGSLFPDLDKLNAALGRKVEFIALIFNHRGFFHSVIAAALFSLLWWQVALLFLGSHTAFFIGLGFGLGYLSHLALDALTPKGIRPFVFGPILKGSMKTGGFVERLFFVLLVLFTGLLVIAYMLINLGF